MALGKLVAKIVATPWSRQRGDLKEVMSTSRRQADGPILLDQVPELIRIRHYGVRTERGLTNQSPALVVNPGEGRDLLWDSR